MHADRVEFEELLSLGLSRTLDFCVCMAMVCCHSGQSNPPVVEASYLKTKRLRGKFTATAIRFVENLITSTPLEVLPKLLRFYRGA